MFTEREVLDQRVARRRPRTPAPMMATGRLWAFVGGVQTGSDGGVS
jgi:hypothetical protein